MPHSGSSMFFNRLGGKCHCDPYSSGGREGDREEYVSWAEILPSGRALGRRWSSSTAALGRDGASEMLLGGSAALLQGRRMH